ncbi:chemotaxis protein CheA [Hydrogenimonas thermophila]|uniref:chemotaxis protein CheA n=1 Tax=Hydrogenimonas thermophila TaxID=223786 RepID=UPI0029370996|nr:chemotaxis protein CheA [Hydrogenimonas thermophila]WOE69404.1 chemotaxis protein CheA [Hydrogenimonas thermophila]WOE71913.1 chemotaxis protein CheA [Hydrogenimonas thermophila]
MDEIKEAFIEESEELFENINSLLLEAEENGSLSKEEMDTLFRDIHTLKGGSGSVGFEKFSKIVHLFESLMDMIRNGAFEATPEIIEFLIDGSDELNNILQKEFSDNLDDDEFEEKYNQFKKQIDSFTKKTTNDLATKNRDKYDTNQKKLIEINGGEIVDLFEKINKRLNDFNTVGSLSKEEISELFREIHTLKASSQFIGFKFFPKYIHELEEYLDKIRDGFYKYNAKTNKFFKKAIKIAEALIDEELNNNKHEIEHILIDIKKEISKLKQSDDVGFELFDETISTSTDQGFEIFDEDSKNNLGFEIFDETKINNAIKHQSSNDDIEKAQKEKQQSIKKDNLDKPKKDKKSNENKKVTLKNIVSSNSIRVSLDKIDILMNKVGDLVITKSMLFQFAEALEDYSIKNLITERLEVLDRNIRELQESVMGVRMIPMSSVYSKLPKVIRDLSKKLGKNVKFEHYGDTVEIDKLMVESLMDPLTHILRNALDHGIETVEERIKAKKPKEGKITISAAQESGQIIITIEDDGAGINTAKIGAKAVEKNIITQDELERMSHEDIAMLIFSPGLSTASKVTDISGRGVGMDVVMNNINSIGGTIKVYTKEGIGTKFVIILPLTLAILDGLNVKVGDHKFIYPLNMVLESFQPIKEIIKNVVNDGEEILIVRDEFIPVIRLHKFFGIEPKYYDLTKGIVIISKIETSKVAIFVDEFMTQEQIVVKSLEKNFRKVKGISASTIRGDGSVGLILDIANIVEESKKQKVSNGNNGI